VEGARRRPARTISGAASPNDPVFWLIHANIDRLWTQWEDRFGFKYEPLHGAPFGHNLRDPLSQFAELGLGITGHKPRAASCGRSTCSTRRRCRSNTSSR